MIPQSQDGLSYEQWNFQDKSSMLRHSLLPAFFLESFWKTCRVHKA